LVGENTASAAFVNGLTVGESIDVNDGISPNPGYTQAVGGGYLLEINGQANPEVASQTSEAGTTVIGINQDGTKAIMAVFDGEQASIGEGFGLDQMAAWLVSQGMYQGMAFDGGGSSEMVARLPGQISATVQNSPSDGDQRLVAECLCFSSTETAPSAATTATIDNGDPLTVLAGSTVPVPVNALDTDGNPASDTPTVTVSSPGASVGTPTTGTGGTVEVPVTAGAGASSGTLTVTAGGATATIPYNVVGSLTGLTVSPSQPDIDNLGAQQLTLSGTAAGGATVTVPTDAATWSSDTPALGTISPTGSYTAAMTGAGLATITATAGGISGTSSVAVGTQATLVDHLTDVGNWNSNGDGGASVSLAASTTEIPPVPGDTGSMDIHYTFPGPATGGVQQAVFTPKSPLSIPPPGDSTDPTAIGMWVKGTDGAVTGKTNLELAESYAQVDGTAVTLYPSTVTYDGWELITADLPAGLQFPLTVSFLDFLVISPTNASTGDVYAADLEALASPRVPVAPTYTAIPGNPSWLQYEESPSDFTAGGSTIAAFDDSHLQASDHNTTGAVVTNQIAKNLRQLPRNAEPQMIQAGGDTANTGSIADLQYSHSVLSSFGIPFHDTVGNHETTQGANPENDDFAQIYGPTHYQYNEGPADVIDLDSSQIGITESDPYQDPAQEQWAWLVQELDADTSPVTIVTTHVPAYDPHTVENSQFSNRYEAQEFESLVQIYQQTHPDTHVILLFGHARGFSENLLDPQGNNVAGGIPNFVVADAGSRPTPRRTRAGSTTTPCFTSCPTERSSSPCSQCCRPSP
jgi:Phosphodiester glycosidase/Calcineurin-like phosphoesterase